MDAQKTNIKSIVAIACGIVGLVLSLILPGWTCLIALAVSVIGIVFAAMGMKEAKTTNSGKGLAVAGLVCGIIGTVFSFAMLICAIACSAAAREIQNAANEIDWSNLG